MFTRVVVAQVSESHDGVDIDGGLFVASSATHDADY